MLVIAAIVIIIFTIIVPSLLRSKIASNESSAIASMKQIATAEEQYKVNNGGGKYTTLDEMSLIDPPYLDDSLGKGKKSGYFFTLQLSPGNVTFRANGDAVTQDKTGKRHFYVDESGVVRYNADDVASSADSPID